MRRIVCALAPLIVLLVSSTTAQAWVPLGAYDVPKNGVATCLRDVGPNRFALLGPIERATTAIDVLQLGPGSLAPSTTTPFGWLTSCPAARGTPAGSVTLTGPAVTAHPKDAPWQSQMRTVVVGGPTQAIGRSGGNAVPDRALAVNPAGAAVLAWVETDFSDLADDRRLPSSRLLAAMRPAGSATFGPAVVIDPALPQFADESVVAGIDGAGRATLAWPHGSARQLNVPLAVATSDASGRFTIDQEIQYGAFSDVALAVNPDGRALLATLNGPPALYERLPGASRFGALTRLKGDASFSPLEVALSMGPDGEAVVAAADRYGGVSYGARQAGGSFSPMRALTHPPAPDSDFGGFATLFAGDADRPGVPIDSDPSRLLSAAVNGDQVAIAWVDNPEEGGPVSPNAAFGTVSGGVGRPERLGSLCRNADAVRATVLADGSVAVAWTDNSRSVMSYQQVFPQAGGRLSVVSAGPTPSSTTAAPEVQATLATVRMLHVGQPLKVRVRCPNGPCGVRVGVQTREVVPPWEDRRKPKGMPQEVFEREEAARRNARMPLETTAPVAAAGATVSLDPDSGQAFVLPGAQRHLPITVTACSPDGTAARTVTLRPRVRGAALRPMPRIIAATAVRQGRSARVVVRTDRPVRGVVYAFGRPAGGKQSGFDYARGHGQRRFVLSVAGTPRTPLGSVELQIVNRDGLMGPGRVVRVP